MNWLNAVETLRRERRPGVLVTVVSARGHAPRDPGAKMVVSVDATWGTIGGGNLEETALARARGLLEQRVATPELATMQLNDKAHAQYGRQCCGGEVTYLLEPLGVVPAVAIFGMGHVGLELARILSRHDLELYCVDSRASQLEPERLRCLDGAVARVHVQHSAVPELVLGTVPRGTHVLILTHDHAEDLALCDAALRCGHLGPIGLIGSSVKWTRFRHKLADEGHSPEAVDRITSPIGMPELPGKEPAAIAVSVAADLLRSFATENSTLPT